MPFVGTTPPRLLKIGAYYKNDEPGGFGAILTRDGFGDDLDLIVTMIVNAIPAYDQAASERGASAVASHLEEQIRAIGNESDPDMRWVITAMCNIHWLENRGHLQPDEFNGMVFLYAKS